MSLITRFKKKKNYYKFIKYCQHQSLYYLMCALVVKKRKMTGVCFKWKYYTKILFQNDMFNPLYYLTILCNSLWIFQAISEWQLFQINWYTTILYAQAIYFYIVFFKSMNILYLI